MARMAAVGVVISVVCTILIALALKISRRESR